MTRPALRRRALLGALPLLPLALAPLPGRAEAPVAVPPADLARIEAYLNGVRSLKARFLQIAPDGTTAQGTAWMVRPGRMRFEYDPPSPLLLVAGHGLFIFRDNQLRQTTNIPLGRTPLGILLADQIRLSGDVRVVGYDHQPGLIEITLVRAENPGEGAITLVLQDEPMLLREWIVTDPQRRETRVSLFHLEFGGTYPDSLFTYIDPAMMGGPSTTP